MSVHLLPDGRWVVHYKIEGKLKREYFGRGPEAEKLARERNDALPLRSWKRRTPEPGGVWFADLAQAYLDAMAANLQEDSRRNLIGKLNSVILPQLGKMRAIQVTPERIDTYVKTRLATGRTLKDGSIHYPKRTTIHRELTDISAILNWAVERRYLTHNPIAKYKKPRRDDEVIQPPTLSEISALMAVAPPQLVRALGLSYYTGIRPGRSELLRRKWSDVDWTAKSIFVESARKGGLRTRQISLHPDLLKLLKTWWKADKRLPTVPETIIHYEGRAIGSLKTSWRTAKKTAKITRRLRPYDLRHAFATQALRQAADLKSVSELLGHSRTDTTIRVYQHGSAEMQRLAVEKLPSVTLGNGSKDAQRKKPKKLKKIDG
jgi:integrase